MKITIPSTNVKLPRAPIVLIMIPISIFNVGHDLASFKTRSWNKKQIFMLDVCSTLLDKQLHDRELYYVSAIGWRCIVIISKTTQCFLDVDLFRIFDTIHMFLHVLNLQVYFRVSEMSLDWFVESRRRYLRFICALSYLQRLQMMTLLVSNKPGATSNFIATKRSLLS